MDRDTVIALARQAGVKPLLYDGKWAVENLDVFAALIEDHLKEQGYRQCAKGQRTTQFCGMLEQAVQAEREACAKVALTGTGEAVQTKTLEIIKAERERIADAIRSRS